MTTFTTAAIVLPEAMSGFETADLCVCRLFTCGHLEPTNKYNQATVVLSSNTLAVILMVSSHVKILRIIHNSVKWQRTNANGRFLQRSNSSVNVSTLLNHLCKLSIPFKARIYRLCACKKNKTIIG